MNEVSNSNDKRYGKWLATACLVGGFIGWLVQMLMLGKPIWWALPLFFVGSGVFTLNGDSIIESFVVLFVVGILLLVAWVTTSVASMGLGTIVGGYIALFVSKLGFAYAKAGVFGNAPFN